MRSVFRFLTHVPMFEDHAESARIASVEGQVHFKLLKSELSKNDSKIVFLVGPWGSGKTVALKELQKKDPTMPIVFKNFFGVRNEGEAYSHLIGFAYRFLMFIVILPLIVGTYLLTAEYDFFNVDFSKSALARTFATMVIGFFVGFVIAPKSRFVLFLVNLPREGFLVVRSLFEEKKKIYVLEDLDRSSMSVEERFGFLAQLPPTKGSYVVTYGYYSSEEYITVIEYITKLNGVLIRMQQDAELTFSIIRKMQFENPFVYSGVWMEKIPIRSHLAIIERTERETFGKSCFEKKYFLVFCYVDYIKENIITYSPGSDGSGISLVFNGGRFVLESNQNLTVREVQITQSFCQSLDVTFFRDAFMKGASEAEQNSSSNWIEVVWEKIKTPIQREKFVQALSSEGK